MSPPTTKQPPTNNHQPSTNPRAQQPKTPNQQPNLAQQPTPNNQQPTTNNQQPIPPMPTILILLGWRLHFYANEAGEPVHVHAQKGDCDCKYWLYEQEFDIEAQYEYNMSPRDRREIRKIIFDHFELILDEWRRWQEKRDAEETA